MATTHSRRAFLKAGVLGAFALAAAGSIYKLTLPAATPHRFTVDERAGSVLAAIIPVMLKDAVASPGDIDAAIGRVQEAIAGLPVATQQEIQELFGLLVFAPARRLLTGVTEDWPQADQEEVTAFLQSWRTSRFALLQSAYHGLHDLITGSWYSHESTWASIGYHGPIRLSGEAS